MASEIDGLTEAEQREHDEFMRSLRDIERRVAIDRANAELEIVREIRLWSLAIFTGVMLIAMLFGGKDAPTWTELLKPLTMLAVASAGFHVVTWALLKGYVRWRYERDE